jgi:hypothetical protein
LKISDELKGFFHLRRRYVTHPFFLATFDDTTISLLSLSGTGLMADT